MVKSKNLVLLGKILEFSYFKMWRFIQISQLLFRFPNYTIFLTATDFAEPGYYIFFYNDIVLCHRSCYYRSIFELIFFKGFSLHETSSTNQSTGSCKMFPRKESCVLSNFFLYFLLNIFVFSIANPIYIKQSY